MTAQPTPPASLATDAPAPGSPGPWDERSRSLLPPGRPAAPDPAAPDPAAPDPAAPDPAARASKPALKSAPRRGSADPVKALMHRHRALCERAVDPLEIAAGLEAHGITDRTAARFRHRDVFSLAEELYARVPQGTDSGAPGPAHDVADGPAHDAVGAAHGPAHDIAPGPAHDAVGAAHGAPGATHSGAHAPHALHTSPTPDTATGREPAPAPADRGAPGRARWTAFALLPGAVCAATLLGLDHTSGQGRLVTGAAGALALSGALTACLRRGPLRAGARTGPVAGLSACWLLAYLLCGDGLPAALDAGGPEAAWPAPLTAPVALALAVVPAAWCAHLFSVHARRRLRGSRGLADFAASARPLLLALVALYALAVTGLSLLTALVLGDGGDGALAPTVALATLFLLARLLMVHGFPRPAAAGLAAACAIEALACASALAGRVPGCDALAVPVRALVLNGGAAAVPTLACATAALALLGHAALALSRASAHTDPSCSTRF
ncbi:hypothetical protein [Streptomyces sp. NPDC088258]|uniref:hypothetical protein n=1 Tax=Streptomyces sp. NPDC088258 TaxID=3365849 RepID=UPI0037F661AD